MNLHEKIFFNTKKIQIGSQVKTEIWVNFQPLQERTYWISPIWVQKMGCFIWKFRLIL